MLQAEAWLTPALGRSRRERTIIVAALPLYHIFALTVYCLLTMRWGAHMTADPESARHPRIRQGAQEAPFTHVPGVNTLFNALLQPSGVRQARLLAALTSRSGGGMAVQKAVGEQVEAR